MTFLRPLSEMNNGNNSYAPYNLDGSSRGPAKSVRQFLKAWRRIALIVRGGEIAAMNRTLRRLGMPPVRTREAVLQRTLVALMWVPLSFGNPEIPKNHPRFFWPGSRYVDWVGTTWYSPYKATSAMVRFYRYALWRRKPFAFTEWGIWGRDDPAFVRQFFKLPALPPARADGRLLPVGPVEARSSGCPRTRSRERNCGARCAGGE